MDEVRLGKKITSHLQISLGNLCTALGLEKNLDSITGGNYCVSETEIFTTAVTLRMKFRLVWNRSCCFLSQIWDLVVKSQCTMRNWSEKDWPENNKIIFTHSLVDVVGPFFTLSLGDLSYAWPQKDLTNGLFFIIVSCFYFFSCWKFWPKIHMSKQKNTASAQKHKRKRKGIQWKLNKTQRRREN